MVKVEEIKNYDEYKSFVESNSEMLHVIKIGAEWCAPCNQLSNTIKSLDESKIGTTMFAEIDIEDDVDEIVSMYGVRSVPVTIFIKNNEILDKKIGSITADIIYNNIEQF